MCVYACFERGRFFTFRISSDLFSYHSYGQGYGHGRGFLHIEMFLGGILSLLESEHH